jgi:hypothetical protein
VAVTLVLILRAMARRFRERGSGGHEESDAPYGPRPPVPAPDREVEEMTSR